MSSLRKAETRRLLGATLLGLGVGYATGRYLTGLLLGAVAYLLPHLYHLLRVRRIIAEHKRFRPPYPGGLWRDIYQAMDDLQTDSWKRKRELSRFTSRFQDASAAVPDALVILDRDRKVDWVNLAADRLLGLSLPGAVGKRLLDLVDYPFLGEYLELADYSRPLEFTPPHNRTLVVSVHAAPFGGKKRQALLVARDITQVHHINETRRDFVANVSHELRTPLTVVSGALENLLHSGAFAASARRPLALMQKQAARMQSIVNDLLTLSQLEMGSGTEPEPVDVHAMLRHIVEEARALSGDQRHVFVLESEPTLWLLGNEEELHSAFSNIVFNAVRHTPGRARITLRWQLREGEPVLSVTDTGAGIPARHIPRLTERFYRVDSGRSRRSGGTGLGLAIVKHVLSRHGAELQIASTIGRGSTFSCHFPVASLVPGGGPMSAGIDAAQP